MVNAYLYPNLFVCGRLLASSYAQNIKYMSAMNTKDISVLTVDNILCQHLTATM